MLALSTSQDMYICMYVVSPPEWSYGQLTTETGGRYNLSDDTMLKYTLNAEILQTAEEIYRSKRSVTVNLMK